MRSKGSPRNDPGADVAERLRPVRIRIRLEYAIDSEGTRRRAGKVHRDEIVEVSREITMVLTTSALDPRTGPLEIASAVGQHLYSRLTREGWPVQRTFEDSDRP